MIPQCYYNNFGNEQFNTEGTPIITDIPIVESEDLFTSRQQAVNPNQPSTCAGCAPPIDSKQYTQGYLKTKIGSRVRIEFLIGTSSLQDRTGTIVDVGISYVIISQEETNTQLLCDIYSIKFVTFYKS